MLFSWHWAEAAPSGEHLQAVEAEGAGCPEGHPHQNPGGPCSLTPGCPAPPWGAQIHSWGPPQETDSGVMTESLTSASPGGLRNSCVVLQHT